MTRPIDSIGAKQQKPWGSWWASSEQWSSQRYQSPSRPTAKKREFCRRTGGSCASIKSDRIWTINFIQFPGSPAMDPLVTSSMAKLHNRGCSYIFRSTMELCNYELHSTGYHTSGHRNCIYWEWRRCERPVFPISWPYRWSSGRCLGHWNNFRRFPMCRNYVRLYPWCYCLGQSNSCEDGGGAKRTMGTYSWL